MSVPTFHRLRGAVSFLSIVPLVALIASGCTRGPGDPGRFPEPVALGSTDVLGYVVIPSVDAAVADVSSLAVQFAPDPAQRKSAEPEALKAQLGAMLGDPGLSNLYTDKPLVALLLKGDAQSPLPSFAIILPAKKAEPYDTALKRLSLQTRFAGGWLLASASPQALDLAEKNLSTHGAIVKSKISGTARFHANLGSLMENFGPLIESQLDNWMSTMTKLAPAQGPQSPESMTRILSAEIRGILAVVRQCAEAQVDISLKAEGLGIDGVLVAKPDSHLGAFFAESAKRPAPSTSLLESGNFISGVLDCDAASLSALIKEIVAGISRDPEIAKVLTPEVTSLLTTYDWWGGAMYMGMGSDSSSRLAYEYTVAVKDPENFLTLLEAYSKLFAPGSSFDQLYKDLAGLELSMALERKSREHAGLPVHRIKMSFGTADETKVSKEQLEQMKALLRDYEIAFVGDRALAASDPARLDGLIDRAKAGSATVLDLQACTVFGKGKHAYLDASFVEMMKEMMKAMGSSLPGQEGLQEKLKGLSSKKAMVFAGDFKGERARFEARIPMEPFIQIMKGSR